MRFQSTLRRTERPILSRVQRYNFQFQSTLRRTERQRTGYAWNAFIGFQSTLRRTERRFPNNGELYVSSYFNPRSDERSDPFYVLQYKQVKRISIHAPTNGATIIFLLENPTNYIFQSTLRRTERLQKRKHLLLH